MGQEPKLRADADRNRRAILRAADELLRREDLAAVSVERVAAEAGVGKGTVFHRFGSRAGLLRALLWQRVTELQEAVNSGPPPLGPGAEPAERAVAFLDATLDMAVLNVSLLAAYEQAEDDRHSQQSYEFWHTHLRDQIAEARADLDADLLAHILLGSLHSDLVRHLVQRRELDRLRECLGRLVRAQLS